MERPFVSSTITFCTFLSPAKPCVLTLHGACERRVSILMVELTKGLSKGLHGWW